MKVNFIIAKFFLACLLCPVMLWAQPKYVCPSKITGVHVFLNQAQVIREGKVNLDEGLHQLVFEKISPALVSGSIEVNAAEGMEILSVGTENDFNRGLEMPESIRLLEDSLQLINENLAEIKADKEALYLQKELLLSNKSIGGANQGVKAEELEDILLIYQKKLQEFKSENIRLSRNEKNLLVQKEKIEKALNEFKAGTLVLNNQIVVQVRCTKALNEALVSLRYLVENVSWQPFYDIRVKDTKSDMQLVLKANITQSTGENWSGIKMKLSTADPLQGGVKPILYPNILSVQTPMRKDMNQKSNYGAFSPEPAKMEADGKLANNMTTWAGAQVQQNLNMLEFEIAGNSNVPSDGKTHQIELNRFPMAAKFGYSCVPVLDKEVFVTAKVQSNDVVSQLNGEANIYLDGTFTGKTFLAPQPDDTLTLTLGKERRVLVKREKVKEMCSRSFFGSNKKESRTYEIVLSNSGSDAMEIVLEDQIPLSQTQDIQVKLLDAGNGVYHPETGMISWNAMVPAKQTLKIRFSFEVNYPSDKIISPF